MAARRRTIQLLLSGLLIPASLTLGACGGSGDGDAATPAADGASAPSTTTAEESESGSGDSSSEFCTRALALEGKDGEFTPETIDGYRDLLEVAPDEVRPRIETVIAYLEAISSQGQAAAQQVAEISQQYATDSVRLVRFVNENC
jgi:hypothetical protein